MTPKLTDEMRKALQRQAGKPLAVEDEQTHIHYVLLTLDMYEKVQALVGNAEFDPNEFMPLVHDALAEDMNTPGMELYDDYNAHRRPA